MKLLGILFVFFGYVLVYAAVAAGGRFATEPWAGLFADAYTGALESASSTFTGTGTAVGSGIATGATTAAQGLTPSSAAQNIAAGAGA